MKIGVLGGTFNPIHNSHIYLGQEFRDKLGLDRLVLVPTYTPPHKSSRDLADAAHRLAMCRLAVADLPGFYVTEYEIARQGKSYTYKTLRHIAEKYPGAELYLLMGGDMFLTVQDWRRPEELYRLAVLCAAQRERGELGALELHRTFLELQGARCRLIDVEAQPLSSTIVRERLRQGADASGLLHPDVMAYIRAHRLYSEREGRP